MNMEAKTGIKGDYRFIRVIGEGAFSRVYLAEDGKGRKAACKVSGKVEMLRKEAELLSRLYHPLFPAYAGYEEWDDAGGLWMEYIQGRSLRQLLRRRGRFSARQTMQFAEELADGLKYLHERQPAVLYRDLKPENVMVCQDGHLKLVDLGCACYQDDPCGAQVGTPGFAPPEQLAAGGTVGLYSDVYGLGKVLQSVMADGGGKKSCENGERKRRREGGSCGNERRGCSCRERKYRRGERKCRIRLEHVIAECIREDPRQRPQDMLSVAFLLTGKREKAGEIICEKNIWESSHKNSCSLPSI